MTLDVTADPLDLPAYRLLEEMRAGRLSPVALIEAAYARIAALNPVHNAIVSLRPMGEVIDQIRATPPEGPLAGLPIAIKDLNATAGIVSTQGSPLFADFVPQEDTLMAARIRAAGAVFIGKTNVPEFGLGSHTYNRVFGPCGNAFDPALSSGGSSGGTAVAVALGMLPVADGSDYGGSLRNPAGWNNIFGFRPSQGRVPGVPALDAYFAQLATNGAMGRDIRDVALLLSVQAGPDPRAPLSLPAEDFPVPTPVDPAGLRIGWLGDLGGHLAFEAGILDCCKAALANFGAEVQDLLPDTDFEALWQAFVTLRHFNVGTGLQPLYADPEKRAQMKPEAVWECEGLDAMTGHDLRRAIVARSAWYQTVLKLFERYDVLAIPTAQVMPFDKHLDWPKAIAGRRMDSYHRWMEAVAPGTLSGCPVLAAPAGFVGGLPMGVQLIGRPQGDRRLLDIGMAWQQALPFATGHIKLS